MEKNMYNFVNIGSDNGLLPDRPKPFPEVMLTKMKYAVHSKKHDNG